MSKFDNYEECDCDICQSFREETDPGIAYENEYEGYIDEDGMVIVDEATEVSKLEVFTAVCDAAYDAVQALEPGQRLVVTFGVEEA